ncbi:MAG: hypothetical protein LBR48_08750 [Dysgonamonadaceae bacterium]|jgi:hypothetical protein|nr:hypothetical protein [Dysgonamonadaceae bacterium]
MSKETNERNKLYATPVIGVTYVELEGGFLSASLNFNNEPLIEEPEDGGNVDSDVIYGL